MSVSTDGLSPLARKILSIDPVQAYNRLVVKGPGNTEAASLLQDASPASLLHGNPPASDAASLVQAGLWLWHDWLDESHRVCQSVDTHDGAFWHAIMHRREGDFPNSKYWYAKCDGHALFDTIGANAQAAINPWPADMQLLKLNYNGWKPAAFVDFVEHIHKTPDDPRAPLAVALQQLEWRSLFDHCVRLAQVKT